MYKVVAKGSAGYKGKRLTDENVNSFPQKLLSLWEKAGIVKKVSERKSAKTDNKKPTKK
jgi:hypothetical protein